MSLWTQKNKGARMEQSMLCFVSTKLSFRWISFDHPTDIRMKKHKCQLNMKMNKLLINDKDPTFSFDFSRISCAMLLLLLFSFFLVSLLFFCPYCFSHDSMVLQQPWKKPALEILDCIYYERKVGDSCLFLQNRMGVAFPWNVHFSGRQQTLQMWRMHSSVAFVIWVIRPFA